MTITMSQVHQFLGTEPGNIKIEFTRDSVVSELEKLTQRLWTRRVDYEYEREINSNRDRLLLFPVEVIVVAHSSNRMVSPDLSDPLVSGADYRMINEGTILFDATVQFVKYRITGGYSEFPADVKLACLYEVQFQLERNAEGSSAARSRAVGDQNVEFLESIPHHRLFKEAVVRHRRLSF